MKKTSIKKAYSEFYTISMLVMSVIIIVMYFMSVGLIFSGRIIEGALLLLAITIGDKVNEDRFK